MAYRLVALLAKNSKHTTTKTQSDSPYTIATSMAKTSSKSKDAKGSSPTPSASAKSTNPTSPPLTSKPNLALHPTNLTLVPCRATVFALRLLPNLIFLCNFAYYIKKLSNVNI